MFKPVSLFIGLRYTRAKRRNHFISFISLMSMLGIALGVMVLITVLSVMNGFDREIKSRVFSMVPPITVSSMTGYVTTWRQLDDNLKKMPGVINTAPYVEGQVLLTHAGLVQPALVRGIIPEQANKILDLKNKIVAGNLESIATRQWGLVLGAELAQRLQVNVGDKVTIVSPQVSLSPAGVMPHFRRFTVTGIFKAGSGFGFDSMLGFINMTDAQKLFELGDAVTGLNASIDDVYMAPQISHFIMSRLTSNARVTDWTDQFGAFFRAVSLEKTMMFFILMLIIAVAVFNLVCTLVMVVNEKESDIAILRTIGATPRTVMSIFIVQGATIGIVGTLLGIIFGTLLAANVTTIVDWIQRVFHVQFLSSNVYFVNYLPSELLASDVWQISSAALLLSLVATIYPAWRASRTEPVEALRYE